jgi:hypothetical protein
MRKGIKVGAEICVDDFSMAGVDQLTDVSYSVQCAAVSPIGVLSRLQVGFEWVRAPKLLPFPLPYRG